MKSKKKHKKSADIKRKKKARIQMPRGKKNDVPVEQLLKTEAKKRVEATLRNLKKVAALAKLNPSADQTKKIVNALTDGLDSVTTAFSTPAPKQGPTFEL